MILIKRLNKVGELDIDVMSLNYKKPQVVVHKGKDIYYVFEVEDVPKYMEQMPMLSTAYNELMNMSM